ncbi:flagellar basal body rod protein FlgC [Tsuneonella sp. CC-YZS046]|uniref:flagellar basal body rod protein FlgC n=1 Tax=Tsuneonella sp. CC-YZS046 TaxID=3042152 RepID=UPI002D78AAF9|nr:flagellar basal body rod protein FlgC [Tsuneonella sp. CC-YZS046]WRO66809.1 flagellar basal body rod protein FlgC [Tsuneonella sp. CC-YZS046]
MASPMNLFTVAQRSMSAQLVRMNSAASNLANAGSIAASEDKAYRPMRAVFAEQLDQATGLSTVRVAGVYRTDTAPVKRHDPTNPMADAEGNIFELPVDQNAEMVEMLESSRQYRNMVEALQTAKQLMLETMRIK